MKRFWYCGICGLLIAGMLTGCMTDNEQLRMPWEKETEPDGSVSDQTVVPTIQVQDDDLPYWVIPESPETGSIFYIDEAERKSTIARFQQGYDLLKQAKWNSSDPNVRTNGNIQTLRETLSKIEAAERPRITYAQMKVAELRENLTMYLGDFMWWDAITIKECKVIDDETADTLNGGKPYAYITAETYYNETIYLYVMDAEAGENYYSDPEISNLRGYPVGISGDGIVLCMVPYEVVGG